MRIITDIDGVLLDWLAPVRKRYGIDDFAITKWSIQECLGLSDTEHEKMWEEVWSTPIHPYPGALDFLYSLERGGHKVVGLSVRPRGEPSRAAKRDFGWLNIPYELVETVEEKLEWLAEHEWDFYIEDCLLSAIRAGERFGRDKVMLLHRPWNCPKKEVGKWYIRLFDYGRLATTMDSISRREK